MDPAPALPLPLCQPLPGVYTQMSPSNLYFINNLLLPRTCSPNMSSHSLQPKRGVRNILGGTGMVANSKVHHITFAFFLTTDQEIQWGGLSKYLKNQERFSLWSFLNPNPWKLKWSKMSDSLKGFQLREVSRGCFWNVGA